MKFMRQYLLSLLLTFAMASGAFAAADLGNTAVISPTDASNGSGTCPSWLGSAAPSTLDDSGRCLQGAVAREWQNRSFSVTSTGSANAYVVAYSVAPAALRSGQVYSFITNFANTGTATVNINTLGAKTIKKDVAGTLTALASGDMGSGQFVMLAYNGTDMIWVNWQGAGGTAATTTQQLTGTSASVQSTPDSVAALWEAGADVSDGAAITIGEGGYFNLITSTTAITSFSITTDKAGRTFRVRFDTARTLTYNATSLIIPGDANITTEQGDVAQIRSLGGGNVEVEWYTRADTAPGGATAVDIQTFTTSGTWTKPSSGTVALMRAWGGGGSGGVGRNTSAGGGGGGGGYVERWVALSAMGATETITINAGGAAQTVADSNGNVGGNTTIGSLLTAYGGGGGLGVTTTGLNRGGGGGGWFGPGGVGGEPRTPGTGLVLGADFFPPGSGGASGTTSQNGTPGFFEGGGGGGSTGDATTAAGIGGDSFYGGGGGGAGAEDSAPGAGAGGTSKYGGNGGAGAFDASNATAGTAPGGGGGGAETGNSGAGAAGQVTIYVF